MKKHKYLFVACLSLFPVMAVAGNDTLHEIMEVPSATNINKNDKSATKLQIQNQYKQLI